jgi:hypothetical protein
MAAAEFCGLNLEVVNLNRQTILNVPYSSECNGGTIIQWRNGWGTGEQWTFVPMN